MPNVAFTRPEVRKMRNKWSLVRDCVGGEEVVKAAGEKYLPAPEATEDTTQAKKRYEKYQKRAVFYNVTGRTLAGLVGQVFSKAPSVELPDAVKVLEKDADGAGSSLEQLAKGVLTEIFTTGRAGLLSDFPPLEPGQVVTVADLESGRIRPRIVPYNAEQIINWRESNVGGETLLTLLVLEESAIVSDDGFEFKTEPRWRVLKLLNFEQKETAQVEATVWRKKDEKNLKPGEETFEVVAGPYPVLGYNSRPLSRIPWQFVGVTNNESNVDEPPLYSIANLNVAHFRNSADLEESSFLVGQPTPVFAGLTQDWVDKNFKAGVYLGSRAAIPLPQGGNAQLLQAEPNNLPKELMAQKEEQMKALGAKLIEPKKVQSTATEAAIAETSEASVLSSAAANVSQAFAKAVWNASKFLAEVAEDTIKFALNSDFSSARMDAQERAQLLAEWQGELITWAEAREGLRKAGVAYEKDDAARKAIDAEAAARGGFNEDPNAAPGGNQA